MIGQKPALSADGNVYAPKGWLELTSRQPRLAGKPAASKDMSSDRPFRGRRVTRPAPGETWATYTTQAAPLPVRRLVVGANDNRCSPPGKAVHLANHEAPRRELSDESTPDRIRSNLRRSAPDAYRTLCRAEELLRPAVLDVVDTRPAAANDNASFGVDALHDITPSNDNISDLIDAYSDGLRTRVVARTDGKVDRFVGGISYSRDRSDKETIEVGGRSSLGRFFGLVSYAGTVVAYGKGGRKMRPSYKLGHQRGPDGDAWTPRQTTAGAPAHPVLAEINRAIAGEDLADRMDSDTRRLIQIIMTADSFAEIGMAEGYSKVAAPKYGRKVCLATLRKIDGLLAA